MSGIDLKAKVAQLRAEREEAIGDDSMESLAHAKLQLPIEAYDDSLMSPYSPICKIEEAYRLSESTQLHYVELIHYTQERNKQAGALLVSICNQDTGEIEEHWFPKKLCSNLDTALSTFYCWTPFLETNKNSLIPDENYNSSYSQTQAQTYNCIYIR